MTPDEKREEIRKKAKESAQKYFNEKPADIEEELEKETTLGNPENLVKTRW
ncbi:hypothetical protein ACFL2V_17525 [Pseudomonadota bacterium]